MTEVKALTAFTDKETGVFRKKGDSFSCEDARAEALSALGAVVITAVSEAPAKKPAKRTSKTKK